MSRKRDDKKQKQKELARQLGVSTKEAASFHHLQENERVTRPEIKLLELEAKSGLLGKLLSKSSSKSLRFTLGLYLVEDRGQHKDALVRRVGLIELGPASDEVRIQGTRRAGGRAQSYGPEVKKAVQLEKLSYTRPARWVALVVDSASAELLGEALPLEEALYAQAAPAPRALEIEGKPASLSVIAGVDRSAQSVRFELARGACLVELKL